MAGPTTGERTRAKAVAGGWRDTRARSWARRTTTQRAILAGGTLAQSQPGTLAARSRNPLAPGPQRDERGGWCARGDYRTITRRVRGVAAGLAVRA